MSIGRSVVGLLYLCLMLRSVTWSVLYSVCVFERVCVYIPFFKDTYRFFAHALVHVFLVLYRTHNCVPPLQTNEMRTDKTTRILTFIFLRPLFVQVSRKIRSEVVGFRVGARIGGCKSVIDYDECVEILVIFWECDEFWYGNSVLFILCLFLLDSLSVSTFSLTMDIWSAV